MYTKMKYVIMCGGTYGQCGPYPSKHFIEILDNEPLVARTVRLLKEAGVEDIAISSDNPAFEQFGVPVIKPNSTFIAVDDTTPWTDGFIRFDEPVCYLFGDVFFSPKAIKTIVETETDDVEFFASAPPFAKNYTKQHAEPFAFKVVDAGKFFRAIERVRQYNRKHVFRRNPIAWELWQVVKRTDLNVIDYTNYTAINDYTRDVECYNEALEFQCIIKKYGIINDE